MVDWRESRALRNERRERFERETQLGVAVGIIIGFACGLVWEAIRR